MADTLGVADAKRRFSELIERVQKGERFVISRRGKPVVALVPPEEGGQEAMRKPLGFAALAGALADVEGFEETMAEVYASRRFAKDRPAPEFD